jgi:hypothetical protein
MCGRVSGGRLLPGLAWEQHTPGQYALCVCADAADARSTCRRPPMARRQSLSIASARTSASARPRAHAPQASRGPRTRARPRRCASARRSLLPAAPSAHRDASTSDGRPLAACRAGRHMGGRRACRKPLAVGQQRLRVLQRAGLTELARGVSVAVRAVPCRAPARCSSITRCSREHPGGQSLRARPRYLPVPSAAGPVKNLQALPRRPDEWRARCSAAAQVNG